jgi:ribose transport system permease protein
MVAQILTRFFLRNPIWGFVALVFLFFSVAANNFFDIQNFQNVLIQTSTLGIIALGMTLVMINGNIDLSVGAILAMAAVLMVDIPSWPVMQGLGDWSLVVALLITIAAGCALGGLNGFLVWKTGVNAFIVTLGAMIGIRGLVFVYTEEQSFYAMNFLFSDLGMSSITLATLNETSIGLPSIAALFLVLVVLVHLLLTKTVHGRNCFAVGGNPDAAVNAGIKIGPHLLWNFILLGGLSALAGVTLSSQMGAATPNLGRDYELWVITAVVLGGTKLAGGAGSITGTLGGVLAIGILRNGMNMMQVPSFYVYVVLGFILISVLLLDQQLTRRQAFQEARV